MLDNSFLLDVMIFRLVLVTRVSGRRIWALVLISKPQESVYNSRYLHVSIS